MRRIALAALFWVVAYLAVVLIPLGLVLLPPRPEPRGFWIEFSLALGFLGFAMMVGQFGLTARFKPIGAPFGMDTLLHFHRQAGIIAFLLVLAHPVVAFISEPAYLAFLDPRVNLPRAGALILVTIALALLIVLPLWRERFGLSYEWWRLTHAMLAMFVVIIGLGHMLMVGHYLAPLWKQALWVLVTGAAVYLIVHARLLKPLLISRRPYRVAEVRPERGSCWSIVLEAEGHGGMRFAPGQFAWLTLGQSPFSLQQHPFSFSSSATEPARPQFAIKELGDFTSEIGRTRIGTRAFLEGPYGRFVLRDDEPGAVLIAGGIGITPFVSMLRTAAERGDRRPFVLIYATGEWERTAFREEFAELQNQIDLKIVHVLQKPPEDWQGERGCITPDILQRHVPGKMLRECSCFVCGPEPMMDAVEPALLDLGVPRHHLRSERFKIV